jgi:hypothetical protein
LRNTIAHALPEKLPVIDVREPEYKEASRHPVAA